MIQSLQQLCDFLQLNPQDLAIDTAPHFPLKVPEHFAGLMEKGNPDDPLLKQVLPLQQETETQPGFKRDPVGDLNANPIPSLIHKYHGRALLMTSPRCDVHCRYCFRRHFPYEQVQKNHWQSALHYLADHTNIEEVILSGGDPFTLSEPALCELIQQLEALPHLTTLRLHSRSPIVAPEKAAKPRLLQTLKQSRLQVVLVVHCNHPNELCPASAKLMQTYRDAGLTLLNQTVLLKDINDNVETLTQLSKKLFHQGILPYYCHLLDKVSGAAHFEVKKYQAWSLYTQLRQQLPGYLVPQFVEEIAGEPYKTVLTEPTQMDNA